MTNLSEIFINPFANLSDRIMLRIGIVAYLWASVQVYLLRYVPDGVFQQHPADSPSWYAGFVNVAINILFPSALLWVLGKILYHKVRWQDVFIVVMLSQIVNYVIGLVVSNSFNRSKSEHIKSAIESGDLTLESVAPFDMFITVSAGFIALALLIYFFYLLVVGMKIAMNSKKGVHGFWIVLVTILADTILHWWYPYIN